MSRRGGKWSNNGMFNLRLVVASVLLASCTPAANSDDRGAQEVHAKLKAIPMDQKVSLPNSEWKKVLSDDRYHVLREAGTEPPFRNEYWNNHEKGTFICAACGNPLFSSDTKFESGTGWPSFFQPLSKEKVEVGKDSSHGMSRDEVRCARCESHIGHVFDDGPAPTGQRYCMNSLSLKLEKR